MESPRTPNIRVIKKYGVISNGDHEFTKELNLVQWYENQAKYDLRVWDNREGRKATKGLTMSEDELRNLYDVLHEMFEPQDDPIADLQEKIKKIQENQHYLALRYAELTVGHKELHTCCYPSCEEPVYKDGFCSYHYSQENWESK